jgi:hypothetical protein
LASLWVVQLEEVMGKAVTRNMTGENKLPFFLKKVTNALGKLTVGLWVGKGVG